MSEIERFLCAGGPNRSAEKHGDVLVFDDATIERRHDFIQWLFPLTDPSAAVPGSPVLTPQDVEAIRSSAGAQAALTAAAARMQAFYARTSHWLRSSDHNHLRITRIIRSLRLLVDDQVADAFRAAVLARVAQTHAPVSARSRDYWMRA